MPQFACPYCQERVTVDLEGVGAVVACSACSRPFRPHVPQGNLVEEGADSWRPVLPNSGINAEERTIQRVRPAAFRRAPFKSLFLFLIAGAAIAAAIAVSMKSNKQWMVGTTVISGVLISLLCIIPLVIAFLEARFESLTVTSQRSLWRRGIFSKATSEVQHDDIRNIQIKQSFLDQILRIGTVSISSAGQDDMEIVVTGVQRPQAFVEMVRTHQIRLERND
ncbi:MAG: putative membrane protein YdbT with pleckstrin-like domain [Planctomycetota bacterium]|jgi:uncharacterized membrane protein YdbT with pleckstrin-like domain